MAMGTCLYDEKMGENVLQSIWCYFGTPLEFKTEINVQNRDREFLFFVSKAAVVDILENRNVHGKLFEIVFDRCSNLGKDVIAEVDAVIRSLIRKKDPFSAFIRLCAILSDFILFLSYKGNFFKLRKQRLFGYWSEYYEGYFDQQIEERGGLEAITKITRAKAGFYPYIELKNFTSKYCNPLSPYNEANIPFLFKTEVQSKHESLQTSDLADSDTLSIASLSI